MSSIKSEVVPTEFQNVQVIAIPSLDSTSGKTKYTTTFSPETLIVKSADTVINYQLISPTPTGVRFKNVVINQHTDQMSNPSISLSGKLVTLSDANTVKETISMTFHFVDNDGVEFNVDPDVLNEPDPT